MRRSNLHARAAMMRRAAICAFLLFAASVWLVFDFLFQPLSPTGEVLEIADYVGMEYEKTRFDDALEVRVEYRHDEQVPVGRIISQTPAAGSRRKRRTKDARLPLSVVVSSGTQTVTLPHLQGRDAREASGILRELGLTVEVHEAESAYAAGQVYEMEPRGGSEVARGSRVTLFVSRGAPSVSVQVPELRGLSRSDALVKIWLAQLTVGDVVEEFHDSVAPGCVVGQSHPAGSWIPAGSKMTLYISRGPAR